MKFALAENNKTVSQFSDGYPLVTFALVAYNQEKYIKEAVESVLSQTYQPLEIIFSDDFSTDNTFEIIKELVGLYKGPHKIILNKNEINIKTSAHVNRVFELASSELIVMGAGDDISLPDRVDKLVSTWINSGKPICAIHSKAITFGEVINPKIISGRAGNNKYCFDDFLKDSLNTPFHGATAAYSKSLHSYFGPLSYGGLIDDRILAQRALLIGEILFCDDILVRYRVTSSSVSGPGNIDSPEKWRNYSYLNMHSMLNSIQDYMFYHFSKGLDFDKTQFVKIMYVLKCWEIQKAFCEPSFFPKIKAAHMNPLTNTLRDKIYFLFNMLGLNKSFIFKFLSKISKFIN